MGYKKQRMGAELVAAARSKARYRDVHVFIGGTGAVGGTALLQMLSIYEEMMSIEAPEPGDTPVLVATGRGPDDLHAFTRRLFRFIESRHGTSRRPKRVASGYMTHSGIMVALERFQLTVLPGLEAIRTKPASHRADFIRNYLPTLAPPAAESGGQGLDLLMDAISRTRPVSDFLKSYLERQSKGSSSFRPSKFRSVVIGIPISSLIAYHLDHLSEAARHMEGITKEGIEELREAFMKAFRDDLHEAQASLAETVLVAHTTAVGGMYDEVMSERGPTRTIRLGFAHSALDTRLRDKQYFAEKLTAEYAALGLKMLITAAAIGIDEIRIRKEVPLHFQIVRKLQESPEELFSGIAKPLPRGSRVGKEAAAPLPSRLIIRIFKPLTVPVDEPSSGPVSFPFGEALRPSYSIRSGENGFFSLPNADALYRVMRVASASELGLILATVGLFGDDPLSPWFKDNVCYYTETDNSRQVFDLLNQPALLQTQLSGLEPMALQDLGSAKHQGELHTLGLLILLHRLRTLDIDAIDPYVDLGRFDPERFFIEHSRALTFEDIANWSLEAVAHDMRVLASAESPKDLAVLSPSRHSGLFPLKDAAVERVLDRVLHAVWMVPSLGSPILFEHEGKTFVRTGFFAAPLDMLVTSRDAIFEQLRRSYEESRNPCSFEDFRDYHICTGGFVDLRPLAILCTAKNTAVDLTGSVKRFRDEETLRAELLKLEPYSFFSTCGLAALLLRLRGLGSQLREAMVELGTLHDYRWQMPRDINGHTLLLPGAVEAFRMVAEGLEKTTGTERLDGIWGYERRPMPERVRSRDLPVSSASTAT